MNRPVTLKEFEDVVRRHDFHYGFSDDYRVWNEGREQTRLILAMWDDLKEQGLGDQARIIYDAIASGWARD